MIDEVASLDVAPVAAPATRADPRVLVATLLAMFLAAMDSTVIGTILPALKTALPGAALYPWIVSGFILATTLTAPFAGKAADVFGARASFTAFLLLFLAGSAAAGAVDTMGQLIAARAVQGVGAGGIAVMSYVVFAQAFPADRRAKMQGLLSSVWGIAAIIGPAVSSAVTAASSWRWVFLINVPLCVVALIAIRALPGRRGEAASRRLDLTGLALLSWLLGSVLLLAMAPAWSGGRTAAWALAASALLAGALLAGHQRRSPDSAVLDTAFYRTGALRAQTVLIMASSIVLFTSVTLVPQFVQEVRGGSIMTSGLVVMLAALGWVAGASIGGGLLERVGFRALAAAGALALIAGAGLLFSLDIDTPASLLYASQGFIGAGIGCISVGSLVMAQQVLPPARVGVATANVQMLRNIGAVIGVNALGALAIAIARGGVLAGSVPSSASGSYHVCFGVLFGLALLSAPAVAWIPHTARGTAGPHTPGGSRG